MKGSHDIYSGLSDAMNVDKSITGSVSTDSNIAATSNASETATVGTLTMEEHDQIQKSMRMTAAARAKTISRAFRNIKISYLSGDFITDFLDKHRFTKLFHIIHLSSRAVHYLSHAYFPEIISTAGGIVITETLRNVVSVKQEQREEFTRRVLGMAGRAGCALVGTDRVLSADTFSVGSVIDTKALTSTNKDNNNNTNSNNSAIRPFECNVNGTFTGLLNTNTALSVVGEIGKNEKKSSSIIRCKTVGFTPYSHNPVPLPTVAELKQAVNQSKEEELKNNIEKSKQILADAGSASASELRSYIRGVAQHNPRGGDNPFPEALVFAYVPQVSVEIAKAINTILNTTDNNTGTNTNSTNTSIKSNTDELKEKEKDTKETVSLTSNVVGGPSPPKIEILE